MQQFILTGTVVEEPTATTTSNGKEYVKVRIETQDNYKKTFTFDINFFGNEKSEILKMNLLGYEVSVTGMLTSNKSTQSDKTFINLNGNTLIPLSRAEYKNANETPAPVQAQTPTPAPHADMTITDDDLPF